MSTAYYFCRTKIWQLSTSACLLAFISVLHLPAWAEESKITPGASQDKPDHVAKLFSEKCSGCHSIGKGKMVGPDLVEVLPWETSDISQAVGRMQKYVGELKENDIKGLVQFLKDQKAPDRLKALEEIKAPQGGKVEIASSELGKKLFWGQEQFKNGGMACMSCHQVGGSGGTLAPDLTNIYDKMGQASLTSACEQTNFKVMQAVYKDQPVTRQEALDLVAYFKESKKEKSVSNNPPVGELGFVGALLSLAAIGFFYRNRNRGVRAKLKRR
jgi:mono/diheme cytochrome c family protein